MMDKADFEVTAHLPLSSSRPPNESITNSYDRSNKQEHKTDGGWIVMNCLGQAFVHQEMVAVIDGQLWELE